MEQGFGYIAEKVKEIEEYIKANYSMPYDELFEKVDQKIEELKKEAEYYEVPFMMDTYDTISKFREDSYDDDYEESSSYYEEDESYYDDEE